MKNNVKAKKVATKKAVVSPSKKVTKPAAKTVKAAAKPVAKKAPAKAVKTAPKAAAKPAPKKSAAKPVAKKATAQKSVKSTKVVAKSAKPVKTAVKTSAKTSVAPKTVEKTSVKASSAASSKSTAKPIVVKMPENQNNAPVVASMFVASRPVMALAPQKQNNPSSATATRPVYRPIQVINKPLAPVQPVRQMAPIEKHDEKVEFKKGDYVVYPAHGVGEIEAVETQTIGGMEIKLYAIVFEKDRMRLKVPVFKAHASGLRRLSTANRMQDALKTLQGRAQIRRAMWSRRAQEYETKINSGDPVSIAEVLRDLKRSNDDTEQSYSERQIYQSALERLAREVAALDKISEIEAAEKLENMIKGRRSRSASADKDEKSEVAA